MFYTNGDRPGSLSEWRDALSDPLDPTMHSTWQIAGHIEDGQTGMAIMQALAFIKRLRHDRAAAEWAIKELFGHLRRQQLEIRTLEDAVRTLNAKVENMAEENRTRAALEAVERIEAGEDVKEVLADLRPSGSGVEGGAS